MAILLAAACGNDEGNPQESGTNPTASTLTASVGNNNSATLTWTECPDDDFSSYVLYRSETSGIAANLSSATLVATITVKETLTHTDDGLAWSTPYYYALQTVDSSQLTAWSNETTITTPDSSGGGGEALTCYQIQGQADESPYDGEDVTVTGIVTVGGNEYYAGSGTAQYAVIEDAVGGEWSGLVLYGYDGILDNLERGDSVVVSGYVSEYFGLTEVVVSSVDFDEAGHAIPAPEALYTGDVAQEKWEGVLVSVSTVTVTNDDLGYGEWYVDDGSGDARIDDLGINGFTVTVGDTFAEIIGVIFYGYDNYKIEPRDESDLTE